MRCFERAVRETKRITLGLLHRIEEAAEGRYINNILESYDTDEIINSNPKEIKTILFIVTRMVRFHGGQTSVLRLGTELSKLGYRVGYAVYKTQSREEMLTCAASNLSGFLGELYTAKELFCMQEHAKRQPDVVVATSWDTVSFAKSFSCYRMYFVQDFEPYFYKYGELFLMAKLTYEQGLHMVSLGEWNKKMIEKHCTNIKALDCIDFPYEQGEYTYEERDYQGYGTKKKFTVAVYLKYYGKRLPCLIQYILIKTAERFKQDGIELSVLYFGEPKSFKTKGGRNLGMLTKKELLQLYRRADFGMAASLSNISLVSLEMPASGLPLIEFEEGSFLDYFDRDCAIVTSVSAENLYKKLKECINNPQLLVKMQENIKSRLEGLSWKKTGSQFADILKKCEL